MNESDVSLGVQDQLFQEPPGYPGEWSPPRGARWNLVSPLSSQHVIVTSESPAVHTTRRSLRGHHQELRDLPRKAQEG